MRKSDWHLDTDELLRRAIKDSSCSFINFNVESVKSRLPDFQFDYLSVNLFKLKENGMLDGRLTSVVHNMHKGVIPSYEKYIVDDPFTPLALHHLGRGFVTDNERPYAEWLELRIFKKHCIPFEIHHATAVAFPIRDFERWYLVFHFMNSRGRPFQLSKSDLLKIEHACVPFWLCWLYKHQQMCPATLEKRLSLLQKITPVELRTIKLILANPQRSLDEIVKLPDCPVGYSGLRDRVQAICGKLPSPFASQDGGYRITQIYRAFGFLAECA